MNLVGISGAINHGKTSFADFLAANAPSAKHYESSDIIIEVANALHTGQATPAAEDTTAILAWLQALPELLVSTVHCQVAFNTLNLTAEHFIAAPQEFATLIGYLRLMHLAPELSDKPINSSNKDDFRPLLQWLGGYLAKHVSGRLWFAEIIRRGTDSGAELILASGIRFPDDAACIRDSGGMIIKISRPAIAEQDSEDVTERERDLITADTVVINDSSLADLQAAARHLYNDWMKQSIKPQYTASDFAS